GGKLEADLTVSKLDDKQFLVVASDTAHRHVEAWMRRNFPSDAHVFVTDVTSGDAQLNVQGPRSRERSEEHTSELQSRENLVCRPRRSPTVFPSTTLFRSGGKLEADLTVSKLDDKQFLVVASDTAHRHVEAWMRRNFPSDAHVFVTDVTSGYAQLNVQGPRSRELLQSLTSVDLSNEAFPFRTVAEIDIGFARMLCTRITYLGELGYELYIPSEQALHVYDRIVAAGQNFGLRHAGLKTLASC